MQDGTCVCKLDKKKTLANVVDVQSLWVLCSRLLSALAYNPDITALCKDLIGCIKLRSPSM